MGMPARVTRPWLPSWPGETLPGRTAGTGIYGAMFIAAAIACAFAYNSTTGADRLSIFETALQFVPQRSQFHEIIADSLDLVRQATGWLDGYERIHAKYSQYGHCAIYQEVATMMNTMRFAPSVGEGICMQVAQGNDTDCFGEIIGSFSGCILWPWVARGALDCPVP